MLANLRILVVEAEFLVALDIQRLLEQAQASKIVFARSTEEASALADRLAEFDLVLLEVPVDGQSALELARQFVASGTAVVVLSTSGAVELTSPEFAGVQLVIKPFFESELLTACAIALATAGPAGSNAVRQDQ